MQSTNEIVEEAKRKRTLASLKPTSLPENHNTVYTAQPEIQHYGEKPLTENQKNGKSVKQEAHNSDNDTLPENHNIIKAAQPEIPHYSKILLTENQKNGNSVKQEIHNSDKGVLPENHNTIKKVKVTVYITEESWEDFNNIYGRRILDKRKTDKGSLMTEAIELLKQRENTRTS